MVRVVEVKRIFLCFVSIACRIFLTVGFAGFAQRDSFSTSSTYGVHVHTFVPSPSYNECLIMCLAFNREPDFLRVRM